MAGSALVDLERAFGTIEHRIGKCEAAREFALRIVPELAYIFGLPSQVFRALMVDRGTPTEPPLGLGSLGPCVRDGFDKIEKLALRQYRKGRVSRRAVHREFAAIEPYLDPSVAGEPFGAVLGRVENAVGIADILR
jgi:hypothetical protein